MELNSRGEVLSLTDSKLLTRGMQGVTESTSLNWLFGVSWMVVMLSSCIWGFSDSISVIHIPKLLLNSKGGSHIVSGTTTQQSCSRIETDGTSVLPGMTINGETVNIFNQISQSASACIGGFSGFYGHSTGQCAVG